MQGLDNIFFELKITQYIGGHGTMCCYAELTLFLLRRPRQEEMTEFFRTTPRVWFKKVTPGYRKTVIQSDSRVHIPRTIDLAGGVQV